MRHRNTLNKPRQMFNDKFPNCELAVQEDNVRLFAVFKHTYKAGSILAGKILTEELTTSEANGKFQLQMVNEMKGKNSLNVVNKVKVTLTATALKRVWKVFSTAIENEQSTSYNPDLTTNTSQTLTLNALSHQVENGCKTLSLSSITSLNRCHGSYTFTPQAWKEFETLVKTFLINN